MGRPSFVAALSVFLAGMTALWLRFHAAPGHIGSVFPYDLLYYYLPMTELAAERLVKAELPLWNPYSCSGIPLLATLQVGVFYPLTWLALVLPAKEALEVRALVECLLAGLFSVGLFWRLGGSSLTGALGGLLYVFACVLGQTFWPPSLSSLVWLPAILLGADSLCRGWSLGWWMLLVCSVSLQHLAGFPQFTVYTYYVVAPWVALRLWSLWRERASAATTLAVRGAALVLAIAMGTGVASIQLMPSYELVGESRRSARLSQAEVRYRSGETPLSPMGALANSVDPSPKLMTLGYGPGAGYVGISTLLLLVLGVVADLRRARTWLLVGLGVLALVLSAGPDGSADVLWGAFESLPGGGMFRDPERLRLISLLCVITLSVRGFGHLCDGFQGVDRRQRRGTLAAVGVVAAAVAVAGGSGSAIRAAAGVGLIAVAANWRDIGQIRDAALLALLAVIALDLVAATASGAGSMRDIPVEWSRNLTAGGRVFVDSERDIEPLRADAHDRVAALNLQPDLASGPLRHLGRVSCLEPLAPRQWPDLHQRLTGRAPAAGTLSGLPWAPLRGFLDLAGVGVIAFAEVAPGVSRAPAHPIGPEPNRDLPAGMSLRILPNTTALPRARLVQEVEVTSLDAAIRAVASGKRDLRKVVLLERLPAPPLSVAEGSGEPGLAEITSYEPERVRIAVRANRAAMLVLSDTFYPGWTARVGDESVEILRAYGLFRAVRVPPGEHMVELAYRPASLVRGGVVSGISIFLAVLVGPLIELCCRRSGCPPRGPSARFA